MSLHPRITSALDRPPLSRLGRPVILQDGTADYTGLNWALIAQLEADNIADWIRFMRRHKCKELLLLLHGVIQALEVAEAMPSPHTASSYPPWVAYAKTGVPGLLVDIASDLDMYTPTGGGLVYHVSTHIRVKCVSHAHVFARAWTSLSSSSCFCVYVS